MTNEIFKMGNKTFGRHVMPTFFDWCQKKGYDIKEVEKFSPKEKSKIVMRYKWMSDNDQSNQDCETTRLDVLRDFKFSPPEDEGDKYWLRSALESEYQINRIKAYFGLISQSEMEMIDKNHSKN